MKQTNKITRAMTAAQELTAYRKGELINEPSHNQAVVYRLYTEYLDNLAGLIRRYFQGFSILSVAGYYNGTEENGAVIEVIGTTADLQSIVHLAGDIRQVNNQSSVLVTWNNVSLLNVTAAV